MIQKQLSGSAAIARGKAVPQAIHSPSAVLQDDIFYLPG
jgi:hypothetical protein